MLTLAQMAWGTFFPCPNGNFLLLGGVTGPKKVPHSVRLTKGDLKLFGQFLYGNNTFQKGASLTLQWIQDLKTHSLKISQHIQSMCHKCMSESDKTRWTAFLWEKCYFVKTKKGWSRILPIWLLIFWEDFKKLSQIARTETLGWTVYKTPGKSPYN